MKKTDQLSVVHAAYITGADTGTKVENATGVSYNSANDCLCWIRKADGDLERARRLRSQHSVAVYMRRYNSDPEFRARARARNTAAESRLRQEKRAARNNGATM
ncbi:MAG: hypothetical protein Q8R82_07125 [Hyphomonadaceae bacterium]|nr:hypothetical protein [Hyphomonadaceae bacterium]